VITLVNTASLGVPVEAESISPDAIAGRTLAEIERLPALQGNRTARLGDFFAVRGEPDDAIRLEGDFARVKYIGKGMTRGRIEVTGDGGMHLGGEMRGGEIHVRGSVGDWVGAEMRGGSILVDGDAGHLLGAAYRGSLKGMRGGVILVRGRAGNEVGCAMRRGLIVVGGDAGDFAGVMMLAGSIFVFGGLGLRTGAGMKRGTIVTYQEGPGPHLLPTFRYDCDYRPAWIPLYLRELGRLGFDPPERAWGGRYRRYSGDFVETGKGEILAWTSA
jgi:formylmethanofuran dehydrogenase subunit C